MKSKQMFVTIYTSDYGKRFLSKAECEESEKNATNLDKIEWIRLRLSEIGVMQTDLKMKITSAIRQEKAIRKKLAENTANPKLRKSWSYVGTIIPDYMKYLSEAMHEKELSVRQLRHVRQEKNKLRGYLDKLKREEKGEES